MLTMKFSVLYALALATLGCNKFRAGVESSSTSRRQEDESASSSTGSLSLTQPDLALSIDMLQVRVTRAESGSAETKEIRRPYAPRSVIAVEGLKPGNWKVEVAVEKSGKALKNGTASVEVIAGMKAKAVVSLKSASETGDLDIEIIDGDGNACAELTRLESQPQPLSCQQGLFECNYRSSSMDDRPVSSTAETSPSLGKVSPSCEVTAPGACGTGIPPKQMEDDRRGETSNVLTASSSCSDFESRMQILTVLCKHGQPYRPELLSCSVSMPGDPGPEPMPKPLPPTAKL